MGILIVLLSANFKEKLKNEKLDIGFKQDRSSELRVAIIDTGIDISHEKLKDYVWINKNEKINGLDDDFNGYVDDINGWNFCENNEKIDSYHSNIKENSHGTNNEYAYVSGTSFAAPMVTGMAVEIYDENLNISPQEAITKILKTTKKRSDLLEKVSGGRVLEMQNNSIDSKECRKQINEDMEELEKCGILEAGIIQKIEAKAGESKNYKIKIGDYTNAITVLNNSDDMFEFEVVQDDITEIVKVTATGEICIDGNKVRIENEEENNKTGDVMAFDSQLWFQKKCPYGKAADYSKYLSTVSNGDIRFTKTLQDISISAYVTVVVAACGGKELAGWVASSVYTALRNYEPNTKGISYKAKKYYHKKSSSSGYINSIRQYVYKYNYTWYTKANYKGKTAKATAYRVKEIY